MKYAADFRAEARDALRGRWLVAVLTGFVASLIGASIATGGGGSGSSNSNSNSTRMLIDEFTATEFWLQFRAVIIGLIIALVVWLIVTIVIGGAGKLGYAIFNESRRIMDGNKWRLFCLSFSFIGWVLLCAAPALIGIGILTGVALRTENILTLLWIIPLSIPLSAGALFLNPYQEASWAAFYRDISATTVTPDPALPESSTDTINGWAE